MEFTKFLALTNPAWSDRPISFAEDAVSVDFDGSTEYLKGPASDGAVGFTSAWTMMVVFKLDNLTARQGLISIRQDSSVDSTNRLGVSVRGNAANDPITIWGYDSAEQQYANVQYHNLLSTGTWYCMIITGESGASRNVAMYLNGAAASTPDSETYTSANHRTDTGCVVAVGSEGTNPSGSLIAGNIQMVALWSSRLSEAESTAIYNGGDVDNFNLNANSGNYVSSANLIHWWRLGINTADIGEDYALTPGGVGAIDLMVSAGAISAADVVADSIGSPA
jgi:hypothetical protein